MYAKVSCRRLHVSNAKNRKEFGSSCVVNVRLRWKIFNRFDWFGISNDRVVTTL